ncbi:MAG TPA: response regulator [Chthoniobacterales bacterium]|jgi:CheY-like chemotaxis protein
MSKPSDVVILITDDDPGHVRLIERNLKRSGLRNPVERFENGQEILDFLFCRGRRQRARDLRYLLLLDVRMPQVDGVETLRRIKSDPELKKLPVIMLTTTDDPREVERCHALGCNTYIVKPVDSERFFETINLLGQFIALMQVPEVQTRFPE